MSRSNLSFQTTYSQDERIQQKLNIVRQKEALEASKIQKNREEFFNNIFTSKSHKIFQLKGLHFVHCNHVKIKFYFKPRDLVEYVRSDVKFYCQLKYYKKYQWWSIKRDSFPGNYKKRIYTLFYGDINVNDEEIWEIIFRIYKILVKWSKQEHLYRVERFQRFLKGSLEDLDMDADDIELFLDEEQKRQLSVKRKAILKRMIVPKRPTVKRKRIRITPSDNSNDASDYST